MYKAKDIEKLLKIIENKDISTLFQAIINLQTGDIMGYEALTRGPKDSVFESPLNLFSAAKENDLLFNLEKIARKKALQAARVLDDKYKVFINVDPYVIFDKDFRSGVTREILKNSSLNQTNIVIELTERTFIETFEAFKLSLDHYRQQGFSVAIDDAGAGYSGLQSIVSIPFDFIKIDRSLIKNIDKDPVKQALLEAFIKFKKKINAILIAEGIEREEELDILIELGVDYGQGYFISRPQSHFPEKLSIQKYIMEKNKLIEIKVDRSMIGDISAIDASVTPEVETSKVVNLFENNNQIQSIVVLKNDKPIGLLMRDKLYYRLGTKYGYAVYMDRPVKLVMNEDPLIIDAEMSIFEAAQQAMKRELSNIYDCILVTKNGYYYGSVSIKNLLEHVSRKQIEQARQLNPLTSLPGNPVIELEINYRIKRKEKFSVLYLDLDNFKPYNDCYGYRKGDDVIKFTAKILNKAIYCHGNKKDVVGHIGGDDFLIITTPEKEIEISKYIIEKFDQGIKNFFNKTDLKNGCISSFNREGVKCDIPLTTISIAIINNELKEIKNHLQLSDLAAELKKYAKSQPGSTYIHDRRIT